MTRKKMKWIKVTSDPLLQWSLWREAGDETMYEARLPVSMGKRRRRFRAMSLREAVLATPTYMGMVKTEPEQQRLKIVDAFNEALNDSRRGERSRRDWHKTVARFMQWLPRGLEFWHEITRQHVREYLATYDGKADTTRRLALQPIVQTARYMSREYELRNVAEGLRLGTRNQRPTPKVYLADVVEFLKEVRGTEIEAGVALQALAGLRLQEATRLTWDKVSHDDGLVEISGDVKTPWSVRLLPVCGLVRESLARARSGKIQSIDGRILPMHWQNYSKAVSGAIRSWNPDVGWQPKDLRNCLPQFAREQGLLSGVWEEYLGHSPQGVTERSYIARLSAVSLGEQEAQEKAMALFRWQVVEYLNQAVEGRMCPTFSNMAKAANG